MNLRSKLVAAVVATCAALAIPGSSGAAPIPIPLPPLATASMATGVGQTCMVDMWMRCLGGDWAGQLGPAASGDSYTFMPITGLDDVIRGTAGWNHTCALRMTGAVLCWGQNDRYQLGGTFASGRTAQQVQLPSGFTATAISAGWDHTCAMTAPGGQVACWGSNDRGELGRDPQTDGTAALPDWVLDTNGVGIGPTMQVATGRHHSCALLSDYTIDCWGDNSHLQLGDSSFTDTSRPAAGTVKAIELARAIGAGDDHTCAVLARGGAIGSVWCWGDNSSGQLGDGTTVGSATPVRVNGPTNVASVTGGSAHTCSVKSLMPAGGDAVFVPGTPIKSEVWCWGDNTYGQLGNGTNTSSSTAVQVAGLPTDVSQVSAGSYFTCALSLSTGMWCWGQNHSAQLGNGTHTDSNVPVQVVGSMPRRAPFLPPAALGGDAIALHSGNRWSIDLSNAFSSGIDTRSAAQLLTVQVSNGVDRPSDSQPIPREATYAAGIVPWNGSGTVSRQSHKPPTWVRVGNRAGKWSAWVQVTVKPGQGLRHR